MDERSALAVASRPIRPVYIVFLLLVVNALSSHKQLSGVFNEGLGRPLSFGTRHGSPEQSLSNPDSELVRNSTQATPEPKIFPINEKIHNETGTNEGGNRWRPSLEWVHECASNASKYAKKPFKVPWPNYALGDCVKMCYKCVLSARTSATKYKSFAGRYFKEACHGQDGKNVTLGYNFTFLDRLLRRHKDNPSFHRPADDELVIHLRLGDVVERATASVSSMLYEGAIPFHNATRFTSFKSIRSVSEVLDNIEESGMSRVTIRGGSHHPNEFRKSRVYAACLKQAISEAGHPVAMTIEKDSTPDQDFYYMVHAKRILLSTGGYSRLIGRMVERQGGKVMGRGLH